MGAYHLLKNSEMFETGTNENYLGKVPENPEIVEFAKSEPFNQEFWKFRDKNQMEWKFPGENVQK